MLSAVLHTVAVAASCEQCVDRVLQTIVRELSDDPDTVLVRIWLLEEGDICDTCGFRDECPRNTKCLHLKASGGRSRAQPDKSWDELEGEYCRFPVGVRKVGRVASTQAAISLGDVDTDDSWLREPDWARAENVRGFVGHPLTFQDELLGVLAVFGRNEFDKTAVETFGVFAAHAAIAIANARAFEEIERLKDKLALENEYLRVEVSEARGFGEIIGTSHAIRKIEQQIDLVAATDSTVLVTGETGTGKELVASEIHRRSLRADGPLIRVNCAAISKELFESEFFGHARGSFTGATQDRAGRFELANAGTIFLDEIGEIPLELQGKLLRVLQENQVERVGESRVRNIDVRVIAATNLNLKEEVSAGRFRQDLYYRLSVFPIEAPALRERKEDIAELAAHFLAEACRRFRLSPLKLKQKHLIELCSYDWPGNIRELQNVVERAAITAQAGSLRFQMMDDQSVHASMPPFPGEVNTVLSQGQIRQFERENILRALTETGGKISGRNGAAELLGLKPTTLSSKIRSFGIRRHDYGDSHRR